MKQFKEIKCSFFRHQKEQKKHMNFFTSTTPLLLLLLLLNKKQTNKTSTFESIALELGVNSYKSKNTNNSKKRTYYYVI